MSVQSARGNYLSALQGAYPVLGDAITNASKAFLNNQFPDDFEYYLCSLELVNGLDDSLIELLVFPVMPSAINIMNNHISSVSKTMNGVVVMENSTFVPIDISINGTFGRKFKMLVGRDQAISAASFGKAVFPGISAITAVVGQRGNEFDRNVKTGYGVTKIMEYIFNKSVTIEPDGTFYKLFFYNFTFNSHYLVQATQFNVNQQKETSNMMWEYNLTLKGCAPASEIVDKDKFKKHLGKLLKYDVLQKSINKTIDFVKDEKKSIKNQLISQAESSIPELSNQLEKSMLLNELNKRSNNI